MLTVFLEHLREKISLISFYMWLKWSIAGCFIGIVAWLHHIEHKLLHEYLLKPMDKVNLQRIASFIYWRATHIIALLFILFFSIVFYDLHTLQLPPEIKKIPAVAVTNPSIPQTPARNFPPVPERDKSMPFDGISVFSEKDADRMAYLDLIKQRYEKLFVTYYYLEECKVTEPGSLELLTTSMNADLAAAAAPPKTGENIMQAALGTYNEIYGHSTCREAGINDIKQSFEQGVMQLRNRHQKAKN